MGTLVLIGGILLFVGMIVAAITAVSVVVSSALWLLLLPFRLIFSVLKLIFLAITGLVGMSLFLATAIVTGVVVAVALVAPLLPVLLVVWLIWWLGRSSRRVARA